ncbi:IS256 family transposase [Martelella lutilitoris]|uniref:Mutator family transposase n=1 Tax=Martelella lutilitoris TaxID=2583532 RepID=A0A7T7KLL9_9HYPH|nr:IS256 family transposase [Martelella lutilitoris]QQM30019.1 IS256 family transposase [Martelella lutilitoris]QQM32172.1 IS256 family transposase [Martelella lutilitoris]
MSIDKELLDRLMQGRSPGDLFGKDGILSELTKALAERALSTEMDVHLDEERAEAVPEGHNQSANRRNGSSSKTVTTDSGKVVLDIPRDRNGTFDPVLIAKYQRRFPDFDRKIISMYARGMTTREIQGHIEEIYGVEASPGLISAITDSVMDEVTAWQNRPLEPCYPIVFMDAIRVNIRSDGVVSNKAVFVALAILPDGTRDVLGLWFQANEGAKFWASVLGDLRNRGVQDILIAVVDGLKGFPQAIEAAFPRTQVQTCIVHLLRHSMNFASYKDRKAVAKALKTVYTAVNVEAAEEALATFEDSDLAKRYPAIVPSWRKAWNEVIPFLDYPPEVRRLIYTTNSIEALNSKIRRAVRTRGHFPSDEAAAKLIYLALNATSTEWKRSVREWHAVKSQLAIMFEERFPMS